MTEEIGMDEVLEQNPGAKKGSVVEGMVVGQNESDLIVDVGLKQEAVVSLREFGTAIPAVGDMVSVLILRLGGPDGHSLASWKQAKERIYWDRVFEKFQKNEPLEGKIRQRIKGGVIVDIGLDAFMPASQIDTKPVPKPEEWVGRDVKVLVLEMDRAKGNVLVSRRKTLDIEKAVKREKTLGALQVGQVMKGVVTGLTNFGAFVDIGGVEGLLHVTDLAWGRVDHPKGHVNVGDELEVKILKYDTATHRISLGRKQLLSHPWDGIETKYSVGAKVKGKVTGLAAFGAFVELEPGIEGLIHISEFSWTDEAKDPKALLKTKQMVDAVVVGLDRAKEKLSLSLKRVDSNPWADLAKNNPVGSQIEGEVTHLTKFGAFVRVAPGVEALLKTGDLSWTERMQSPDQLLKVGDIVKAVVLDINLKEEKMSLGLKQLNPDPVKQLRKGQVVKGTVIKVTDFGIVLKLESGLEAMIKASELFLKKSMFSEPSQRDQGFTRERGSNFESPHSVYKDGDIVQAIVTGANKKDRKIELSVRRFEQDQERELLKKYTGQTGNPTLGEATGWTDDGD